MRKQKTLSPLDVIETKPYRKSRPETLLRLLVSSSFPHYLLGNITICLVKGFDGYDEEALLETARGLREQEKSMSLNDFIRCIEIIKDDTRVSIDCKRMCNIDSLKNIVDNINNHESFVTSAVEHDGEALGVPYAQDIAKMLLRAYYRARAVGPDKQRDVETMAWIIRNKQAGEVTTTNYHTAEHLLVESLSSVDNFHIMLTQNAIILKDKGIRITTQGKDL